MVSALQADLSKREEEIIAIRSAANMSSIDAQNALLRAKLSASNAASATNTASTIGMTGNLASINSTSIQTNTDENQDLNSSFTDDFSKFMSDFKQPIYKLANSTSKGLLKTAPMQSALKPTISVASVSATVSALEKNLGVSNSQTSTEEVNSLSNQSVPLSTSSHSNLKKSQGSQTTNSNKKRQEEELNDLDVTSNFESMLNIDDFKAPYSNDKQKKTSSESHLKHRSSRRG